MVIFRSYLFLILLPSDIHTFPASSTQNPSWISPTRRNYRQFEEHFCTKLLQPRLHSRYRLSIGRKTVPPSRHESAEEHPRKELPQSWCCCVAWLGRFWDHECIRARIRASKVSFLSWPRRDIAFSAACSPAFGTAWAKHILLSRHGNIYNFHWTCIDPWNRSRTPSSCRSLGWGKTL